MALWLKCFFLFLQLSFVLSAVIVVKLEDEEDIQTITKIIESKIDKQDAALDLLNSTFQDALDHQQVQIDGLTEENKELKSEIKQTAKELLQLKKTVAAKFDSYNSTLYKENNEQQSEIKQLGGQIQELNQTIQESAEQGVPSWFYQTQLCYQWRPDGSGVGQCGAGEPRKLCAYAGRNTQFYRDDTDGRSGGCRMQWGIVSPNAETWFRKVKICYRWYADGDGGQCGGGAPRSMCADVGSFTQEYRDDTDRRGGGCRMSWMLSIPSSSPPWLTKARLCYDWYPDGDGGQCGGGAARKLCATANSWTSYYRDDTDRRGGGCRMSWGLYL